MAGNLSEEIIKNHLIHCPKHSIPCALKTGTTKNDTYGKSFFICNYTKDRCTFAASASEFVKTTCPIHDHLVELKAFAFKEQRMRCYYRCVYGKETRKAWCGNSVLPKSASLVLNDITTDVANVYNENIKTKKEVNVESNSKMKEYSSSSEEQPNPYVFHVPQTAEVFDVSLQDTGSCNFENKPTETLKSNANATVPKTQHCEDESRNNFNPFVAGVTKHAETITIADSSDEEERLVLNSEKENESVEGIKKMIEKQKALLLNVGSSAPDHGAKIKDHLRFLYKQLDKVASNTKVVLPTMQIPDTTHNQQSRIDLGCEYPHSFFPSNPPLRAAPLFGGRMTKNKLKEVGRVTKEAVENLHRSLDTCPSANEEAEDPEGLNVFLMTHQKQAIAWLLWRERQVPSGGILADDMGLGKTLTMISLSLKSKQDDLCQIKESPDDSKLYYSKSTLVICPASLVHQWNKEVDKRVKKHHVKVYVHHGTDREKRVRRLAANDIVLTTYNIVSIEGKPLVVDEKENAQKNQLSEWLDATQPKKQEAGPLFKIFWRRIVLDEGHTIKNHKTAMSLAVCGLEGESRWIVTGTPIQNKTLDLYSLVKFLRVSPFDEYKVWKREVDNKSLSGTRRLNSLVSSLLLRRTKDQVDKKTGKPLVSLPKRSSIVHKLKLSKDEAAVYTLLDKFSKNMFTRFLHKMKDSTDGAADGAGETVQMPAEVLGMNIDEALTMFGLRAVDSVNSGCILVMVLRLRQCCGHLSLMSEAVDDDLRKSEGIDLPIDEQFGNMSILEDSKCKRPDQLSPSFESTKISALIGCLRNLREQSDGERPIKSVIVSQWTRMLDIIARHLKRRSFQIDFITGSVNAKKRSDIVERFNTETNPQVLLVSLKAGGVGLNLIGGSHLFLLDQHWNPALEDQACDRVYRVGQQNDVVIHRFLCEDTIEERIVKLQEQKKSIANSVLYGGKSQKLTLDDLKMIFGISR